MEHDSPKLLFGLACEYLSSVQVVRPGVVHLLEHVATARTRARAETWTRVAHLLDARSAAPSWTCCWRSTPTWAERR